VAWKPGDAVVASAGFDGTVRLHESATGKLIKQWSATPSSLASR
jgi:hypothetical protein